MDENSMYTECQEKVMHIIPQSIVKGGQYEVKIENIYDPSKFWIIIKFKELTIFMKYLKTFYDEPDNRNHIQSSDLKKNLMCIVCRNDMYYRSLVLPLLLPDKNAVRVFMLDFGYIVNVHVDEMFHIFEKHCYVPRFAIRASLAYISPVDQSESWRQTDLKLFCEILEKKIIFVKVCEIDTVRNVLFIEISVSCGLIIKSVNDMLVNLKLAIYNNCFKNRETKLSKYKCKVTYPHLFPSFEALESGKVPSSLWENDLLKHSVPLDLLYKDYYQYQD